MTSVKINIMQEGDKVLSINQNFISIQRKNGEVDIFNIFLDDLGYPRISTDYKLTIGFGSDNIELTGLNNFSSECKEEMLKVITF